MPIKLKYYICPKLCVVAFVPMLKREGVMYLTVDVPPSSNPIFLHGCFINALLNLVHNC